VTACDVGTTPADMAVIRRETRWATGAEIVEGGSGDSGVLTAYGVYLGDEGGGAAAFGDDSLDRPPRRGPRARQGRRSPGRTPRRRGREGHRRRRLGPPRSIASHELPGVTIVGVDEVLTADADIVSPNALGGILTADRIEQLQAAGRLRWCEQPARGGGGRRPAACDAGMLYAPDYVVNAGGVINVADELAPRRPLARNGRSCGLEAIPATLTGDRPPCRGPRTCRPRPPRSASPSAAWRRSVGVRRFWLP
jgi:valine dehydrogenase (NAD+)